jgi:hypothetical protein
MPHRLTYERYIVHTIMPATGWQTVYHDHDTGQHVLLPLHVLALAHLVEHDARTQAVVQAADPEQWRIVGLQYLTGDGCWDVCEDDSEYCGLLPPGETLEQYEAWRECLGRPPGAQTAEEERTHA